MNDKLIIGIDSDVKKSGVAVLNGKELLLNNLAFFDLRDFLVREKENIRIVKVEAGYLNKKSNFRGAKNIRTAARIGKNVGACNEVAKKIVEMCNHYGLPVREVKPFHKIWKGRDGKISHEELLLQLKMRNIKNDSRSTNQDQRDAALICLIG